MPTLISDLQAGLWGLLDAFSNPHKRVFVPYLLTTLLIAAVLWRRHARHESTPRAGGYVIGGMSDFKSYIWSSKTWFGSSARTDYALYALNVALTALVVAPYLLSGATLAALISEKLTLWFGPSQLIPHWGIVPIAIAYTITFALFSDFTRFFLHYLAHRVGWLWQFHKVHHSATVMNPMTLYRAHPLEHLLFLLRGIFAFGLVTGLFNYGFHSQVMTVNLLGVNIIIFTFNVLGANLRHSHIWLSYGDRLEHIFISPAQHQLHHSNEIRFYHKNMGSLFAFWDWMFGTLCLSKGNEKIRFGIDEDEMPLFETFWGNLLSPFRLVYHRVVHSK